MFLQKYRFVEVTSALQILLFCPFFFKSISLCDQLFLSPLPHPFASFFNATPMASTSNRNSNNSANDELHNVQFEGASASGASLSVPVQCSALRKNGHVLIKTRPCKIVEMTTSKTGKHGHAKVHLIGLDIFTGKKLDEHSPSTHNMEVPQIARAEYTVLDIDDGFLNLLGIDGKMKILKEDVRVPEGELGDRIREEFEQGKELIVTVIAAMGEEAVIAHREAPRA